MDFPKESVEYARSIVSKYLDRGRSKKILAYKIYKGSFIDIDYGFSESIESGNCGKYLHEIKREADCFAMAGVLYLVSREAGLNPKIYHAYEMRDTREGARIEDSDYGDHAFISVSVGRDREFIIDPFFGAYGRLTQDPDRNLMRIYWKSEGRVTYRTYSSIEIVTQDEYIKKLEENRSPSGGRIALSATQRVNGPRNTHSYVTYRPESKQLESSLHFERDKFSDDNLDGDLVIDLVAKVDDAGEFNFDDGEIRFYNASNAGWTKHINPQEPIRLSVKECKMVWDLFGSFSRFLGRKSSIDYMDWVKLYCNLIGNGLESNFTIMEDSSFRRLTSKENLEIVQSSVKSSVEDYLSRCKLDDMSYESLIRQAHYTKAKRDRVSKDNLLGFVFSKEEHEGIVKDAVLRREKDVDGYCENLKKGIKINAGLIPGHDYMARRKNVSYIESVNNNAIDFNFICGLGKSSFPLSFNFFADREIFRYRLADRGRHDLEEGIDEIDLVEAANDRLFSYLILSSTKRPTLFLPRYIKGLKKILKSS